MTVSEFQTATDLERVRVIRRILSEMDASGNIGEKGQFIDDRVFRATREQFREWDTALMNDIVLRKERKTSG